MHKNDITYLVNHVPVSSAKFKHTGGLIWLKIDHLLAETSNIQYIFVLPDDRIKTSLLTANRFASGALLICVGYYLSGTDPELQPVL